jgi:uncharacterized small protein (DUF1192 family)
MFISMQNGLLKQTLKTLFNMETHRKYYLDLRGLLGSDYVLTDMSDEEVIGRLIDIVYVLQSAVDVEELRAEIAYLESEVSRLEDELENAKF